MRSVALLVLILLGATAVSTAPALAASHDFELHVRVHGGKGHQGVSLDIPWTPKEGGDPFNFCRDADYPGMMDLRTTWRTLKAVPEGRVVVLHEKDHDTRATRVGDSLVLEPMPRRGHHDVSFVKIPGEVVEALVQSRDGRMTEDMIARSVDRHGRLDLVTVTAADGDVRVWIDRAHHTD